MNKRLNICKMIKKCMIVMIIVCISIICLLFSSLFISYKLSKENYNDIYDYLNDLMIDYYVYHATPAPYEFDSIAKYTDYYEPLKGDFYFTGSQERETKKERFIIKESDERDKVDFELYEHEYNQGFYEYYFWINAIDTGTVYLKITELGWKKKDYPLRDFRYDTGMEIYNQSDGFVKCGPIPFVLHHDVGFFVERYFFLARFELWYKPKNTGEEHLLTTKIYKVRGFID